MKAYYDDEVEAFRLLKLDSWSELLTLAAESGRAEFDEYLQNRGIPCCEVRCQDGSICCRAVDLFHEQYGFKVTAEDSLFALDSPDAADAAAACICLGYVLASYELEADWGRQQVWINDTEWVNRQQEGLIVEISSNNK